MYNFLLGLLNGISLGMLIIILVWIHDLMKEDDD